eukprot:2806503-Amphidinium_carterae.1
MSTTTRGDKKKSIDQNRSTGKDMHLKDINTTWKKHTEENKHEIDKNDEKKDHRRATKEQKRNYRR